MRNSYIHSFVKKIVCQILLSTILICSACKTINPWERETLAKPEMAYEPRKLDFSFRQHMYYAREDTSGGYGTGGGGCGCN